MHGPGPDDPRDTTIATSVLIILTTPMQVAGEEQMFRSAVLPAGSARQLRRAP